MSNLKVHLDPGHYGSKYNQSSTNKNFYESAMTWKLAGYLKTELENRGVTVTLSRTTQDANPALHDRGYGAKGCQVFISIHSNACDTESVDYPVVYRGFDKEVADELALKLAQAVQNLMETRQPGKTAIRKGTNGEYYGVLRGARDAGLTYYYIIEHSFHTNSKATEWLLNDNNLKKLAKAEAEIITSYFNVEANVTPAPAAPTSAATTTTATTKKSNEEVAQEVINGKWGNGNDRKANLEAAGYIYADIQAIVNKLLGATTTTSAPAATPSPAPTPAPTPVATPAKKSDEEVAKEVLNGSWGNGDDRKKKLEAAGYNYSAIQNIVNKLLGATATSAPAKKSNEEIAREVINGKWGNGNDRKKNLENAGYSYTEIQKIVNKLLK